MPVTTRNNYMFAKTHSLTTSAATLHARIICYHLQPRMIIIYALMLAQSVNRERLIARICQRCVHIIFNEFILNVVVSSYKR